MSDAKVGLAAAKARLGGLAKAVPSLMQSFAAISKVATTPGQFSAAQKELVAVAIAVRIAFFIIWTQRVGMVQMRQH
jgi:alkylhydroperoxidase/carboxymuconolactone decarboxylase family protein YurZ